jgi:3-phosphoshikimate 1-carboxyvinyltransferase
MRQAIHFIRFIRSHPFSSIPIRVPIRQMNRTIPKAGRWRGSLNVPGDKSVSHRALMMAALAEGKTEVTRLAPGKDVASTAGCLRGLGVAIDVRGDAALVHGRGSGGFSPPARTLDAGNSGTTVRLLSGILAAQPFASTITGDASIRRRPMKRIVEPLRAMGALIETSPGFLAPLSIRGSRLHPIDYVMPVPSAQVKSCILLAALFAEGRTSVTESALSRDHTERMFEHLGIRIGRHGLRIEIEGPQSPAARDMDVPGDISSAAFPMIAAALIPDSELTLLNVGVNPTRTGVIEVLRTMGCSITESSPRISGGEPRADLIVRTSALRGTEISGAMIPKIIDEIPILAVAASQAEGRTVVRDATELRVKETDRIAAVATNLEAMGIHVDVFDDGFAVEGPQKLRGAVIDSMDDHRIAMAFAVAGLVADGETRILKTECADISFPGFFDLLERVEHA